MSRIFATLAGVSLAALLSSGAYAQQTTGAADTTVSPAPSTTTGTHTNGTNTTTAATNSDREGPSGSLEKSNGMWRASKLIGSRVYNQNGDTVGSVDELLVDSQGKLSDAVLSVGGFLGIGSKLVSIPFDQLKFQVSRQNNVSTSGAGTGMATGTGTTTTATTTTGNGNGSERHEYYSLVLPNATKDSLTAASGFRFSETD